MLDQLIEKSMAHDEHKTDFGPASAKTEHVFNPDGNLIVSQNLLMDSNVLLHPTDWAMKQVCARLGATCWPGSKRTLPFNYIMACPPGLRARQLNHWLNETPQDRKWFVRAYDDQARAVLTNRYTPVDVTDVLKWVAEAIDSSPGTTVTFEKSHVGPDSLHLKVIHKTVDTRDDGDWGTGAYIGTGEIGNYRIRVIPLAQRSSCVNSIYWPHTDWTLAIAHVGHTVVLKTRVIAAIFSAFEGAAHALEQALKSRNLSAPKDFEDYIDDICARMGWSVHDNKAILMGSENDDSLFGVAMGISAAAKRTDTWCKRVEMELEAGRVLISAAERSAR